MGEEEWEEYQNKIHAMYKRLYLHPLYPKIHMAELLCDVPNNPIFFHFLPSKPLFY